MLTIEWAPNKVQVTGLEELIATLTGRPVMRVHTIELKTGEGEVQADPPAGTTEEAPEAEGEPVVEEKPKRGRKKAEESLDDLLDEPPAEKPKAKPAKSKVTANEILRTVKTIMRAGKRDEVLECYKEFGCGKPSELKEEQFEAFLARLAEIET